ncbi:MAG: MCE family protein [Fimbriimonadaceae bacterium]|nr:MCE family protein [Fimbriimonadaceae bacterium]
MSAAARVGLIVIVFIALGIYAIGFLRQDAGPQSTRYQVVMADAAGLSRGSKVTLAGVEVGRVASVGLREDGKAVAQIDVKEGVTLREGVTATIPTSLVSIGVTELRLSQKADVVASHDPAVPIVGTVGNPLKGLVPDLEPSLVEVNKTLVAVQGLLGDEELRGNLILTMKAGQDTARDFGNLARRLDSTVAQNQSVIRTTLVTASDTLKDLQAVSQEVNRMIASGELQDKTTAMLDTMNRTLLKAEALVTDVQALASDPQMTADLKATLQNVRVASESGPRIASNAETIAANGATVSEEAVALMQKANEMAEEVQDLIEKFNETIGRLAGGSPGGTLIPGVRVDADVTRLDSPSRIRTDVSATVPIGTQEDLILGLYDAFEANKLTAQLRRPFGPSADLRYGVYAGQPGVGVDYRASSRVGVQTNAFGLNNTQFDARLQYDFGQGTRGFFGFDDIFRRNRLAVGVGIRR